MRKEELALRQEIAAKDGYQQISGGIAAADSANDLPIGKFDFIPNGEEAYDLKLINVRATLANGQNNPSPYAGKKIQLPVTRGNVVIDGNNIEKNVVGIHTGKTSVWVVEAGQYRRLQAYEPKAEGVKA